MTGWLRDRLWLAGSQASYSQGKSYRNDRITRRLLGHTTGHALEHRNSSRRMYKRKSRWVMSTQSLGAKGRGVAA